MPTAGLGSQVGLHMTTHSAYRISRALLPAKIAGLTALIVLSGNRAAHADWAEDALRSEADYLVNCSFTTFAKNHQQVQLGDDAYGALNNVRLAGGPDWV